MFTAIKIIRVVNHLVLVGRIDCRCQQYHFCRQLGHASALTLVIELFLFRSFNLNHLHVWQSK